jgi:hypothetical protein
MGRVLLLFLLLTPVIACTSRNQWGLPRVAVHAVSPDGRVVALVRNHPAIDPPDQSLALVDAAGNELELRRLSADQDWCKTVAWSGDSSTVAYLVQDLRLIVVDARAVTIVADHWLAEPRDYPPNRMASELAMSSDGREASFRLCVRGSGTRVDCGPRQSYAITRTD